MDKSAESGSLRPTTSLLNPRYERTSSVASVQLHIPAGFGSFAKEPEPRYLPPGFSAHTHPEGQVYFSCTSTPRIVTEANVYSSLIQEKIAYWFDQFKNRVATRGVSLPDTAELYLQLDDTSDSCLYYLIDYATRIEFWIEDELLTEDLDLQPVTSESHLKLMLQEHFWTHVEQFSVHRCHEVALYEDELATIFLHARTDRMTSAFSTVPYTAEQCTQYLDVLNCARSCTLNGYVVTTIARLWVLVYHQRVMTNYGEEHARLSIDQSILETTPLSRSWLYLTASRLLFAIPAAYERQFDALFVDRVAYEEGWCKFVASCLQEWTLCAFATFALLIVDILLLLLPSTSCCVMLTSIIMCNIAIVSAAVLLVTHREAASFCASDASVYLSEAQREASGFRWNALAFSLPKALLLWALGTSSMQSFVWLWEATNIYVVAVVVSVMFAIGLHSRAVSVPWLLPKKSSFAFWRVLPRYRAADPKSDECKV